MKYAIICLFVLLSDYSDARINFNILLPNREIVTNQCGKNISLDIDHIYNRQIDSANLEIEKLHHLLKNVSSKFNTSSDHDGKIFQLDGENHLDIIKKYCRLIQEDRIGFLGSLHHSYQDILFSLSKKFNIPYITWDSNFDFNKRFNYEDERKPDRCQIFSLRQDITDPLIDYLTFFKWHKFIYLYNTNSGFKRMEYIGQYLHKQNNYGSLKIRKQYDYQEEDDANIIDQKFDPTKESMKHPDITDIEITMGFIDFGSLERTLKTLREVDEVLSRREQRLVVIDLGDEPIGSEWNRKNLTATLFLILSHIGMIREEYHYLLTDFDIHDHSLGPFKESGVNISGFHLIDFDHNPTKALRLDGRLDELAQTTKLSYHEIFFIEEAFKVMKKISEHTRNYIRETGIKSKVTCRDNFASNASENRWNLGDNVYNYLVRNKFKGEMTNFYHFDSKKCTAQQIYVYLSKFHGEAGAKQIATWTEEGKWILLGDAKKNLQAKTPSKNSLSKEKRKTLRVVTYLDAPFASIKQGVNSKTNIGKEQLEGYCLDLAERIFSRLDYDYTVQLVKDSKFGAYVNGSWNGMMGELVRGEADICIGPLTVTSDRAEYILFTDQFMTFGLSMMMRKPIKTKPGTFSFLSPLKSDVWLGILGAGIAVSLSLKLISLISPVEWSRNEDKLKGFSLHNGIWFSMASFVHQGIDLFPLSSGARVIAAIWRFFCLLMMAYYTANLAAALSFEKTISPINSIQDLYEKPELGIKIGMVASGSTREFFKKSNDKIYKGIYERVEKNPHWTPSDMDDGYQRVRKSSYALILESKMNEYQNSLEPCNTMMVGGIIGNKNYAIGISKMLANAKEIRDNITDQILLMREDHTLRRMYEDWWFEKSKCRLYAEMPSPKPLALVNISGTFYILISGLMVAMLIGTLIMTYKLKFANKMIAKETMNLKKDPKIPSDHQGSIKYGFYSTEF